jgi:hypothetical protein
MFYAFGMDGPYGTGSYLMEEHTGVNPASATIQTDDLDIPVGPAAPRICERVYTDEATCEELFYNEVNVVANNPSYPAARPIAVLNQMANGNYAIIYGQSLPFLDQDHADTKTFGNRLMALWGVADSTP